MTYVIGVIGAGLLFGLFALLRPSDEGCTGQCIGCTRSGACQSERRAAPSDEPRHGP